MNKPHKSERKLSKGDYALGIGAFIVAPLIYGIKDAEAATTAAKMQRTVVRAELPYVMHNEVLASGIKVTCVLTAAWAGRCLMRAYDGNKTILKLNLNVRRVPTRKTLMFEDYSGWVYVPAQRITYKIEPLD